MTLRASATPQQYKTCSKCRLSKPVSEFNKASRRKGGLYSSCKKCCAIAQLAYRQRPEINAVAIIIRAVRRRRPEVKAAEAAYQTIYKQRSHVKAKARKKRTGFTQDVFETALLFQKGRCAICSNKLDRAKQTHADHSHQNKKPRGVLCARCNIGLGNFKDSPELLEAAAAYLRNPPLDLV